MGGMGDMSNYGGEGMPGMGGMGGMPGMEGLGGMPGMEGLGGMAGMPDFSSLAGMAGMPGMGSGDFGGNSQEELLQSLRADAAAQGKTLEDITKQYNPKPPADDDGVTMTTGHLGEDEEEGAEVEEA